MSGKLGESDAVSVQVSVSDLLSRSKVTSVGPS